MRRLFTFSRGIQRRVLLWSVLLGLAGCSPKASSESVSSSGSVLGDDAGNADGDDSGDGNQDGDGSGEETGGDGVPSSGDGSPLPARDSGTTPDGDASTDEGWTPVGDGEPDTGTHDGGTPGECLGLAPNTNSGSFGTTGAVCFTLPQKPATAWEVYFADGRTITINGTEVSAGQMPFPGSAPFTVTFSAGAFDYTAWAYW